MIAFLLWMGFVGFPRRVNQTLESCRVNVVTGQSFVVTSLYDTWACLAVVWLQLATARCASLCGKGGGLTIKLSVREGWSQDYQDFSSFDGWMLKSRWFVGVTPDVNLPELDGFRICSVSILGKNLSNMVSQKIVGQKTIDLVIGSRRWTICRSGEASPTCWIDGFSKTGRWISHVKKLWGKQSQGNLPNSFW